MSVLRDMSLNESIFRNSSWMGFSSALTRRLSLSLSLKPSVVVARGVGVLSRVGVLELGSLTDPPSGSVYTALPL